MKLVEIEGGYAVEDDDGERLTGPLSNASAWRWIDRQAGDPTSRAESVNNRRIEKHLREL